MTDNVTASSNAFDIKISENICHWHVTWESRKRTEREREKKIDKWFESISLYDIWKCVINYVWLSSDMYFLFSGWKGHNILIINIKINTGLLTFYISFFSLTPLAPILFHQHHVDQIRRLYSNIVSTIFH